MENKFDASASEIDRQEGKTFLITGSNTGLGFVTARVLAGMGGKILMACRNPEKGKQALARLKAEVPAADCDLLSLDLADLRSIRKFAETVNAQYKKIDVLINNAGVMIPPFGHTADGFETQFGTNVLGHFALTGLLLPSLGRTPQSRVVTVASIAHWVGRIDFDNLNAEKAYSKGRAYAQSKLANLLLTYELQRRFQRNRFPAISLAAHPGGSSTDLNRHSLLLKVLSVFVQSPEAGAMSSIRAAADPDVEGGEYYGPSGVGTLTGAPIRQRSSRRSHDPAVAERLWNVCEELTGVRYLDQPA